MANHMYDIAGLNSRKGTLDIDAGLVRITLLQDTTTADTERDKTTVSGFTTLGEANGSGFTWGHGFTGRKLLAAVVWSIEAGQDIVFDCTDPVWAALGNSTNPLEGALVLLPGTTDDTDAIPIFHVSLPGPTSPGGSTLTLNIPDAGSGGLYKDALQP